jgi:hypothetical protein
MKILNIMTALLGAVGIYAAWYRIYIGEWCPAMWLGSAPMIIIPLTAIFLARILNIVNMK